MSHARVLFSEYAFILRVPGARVFHASPEGRAERGVLRAARGLRLRGSAVWRRCGSLGEDKHSYVEAAALYFRWICVRHSTIEDLHELKCYISLLSSPPPPHRLEPPAAPRGRPQISAGPPLLR